MRRETKSFPPGATDFLFSSDPEKEEERGKESLFLFFILFLLAFFPVSLLLQQEKRNGEKKCGKQGGNGRFSEGPCGRKKGGPFGDSPDFFLFRERGILNFHKGTADDDAVRGLRGSACGSIVADSEPGGDGEGGEFFQRFQTLFQILRESASLARDAAYGDAVYESPPVFLFSRDGIRRRVRDDFPGSFRRGFG